MQTDSTSIKYVKTFDLGRKVDERLLLRALAENSECTMRHSLETGKTTVVGDKFLVEKVSEQYYYIVTRMNMDCAIAQARYFLKFKSTTTIRNMFIEYYIAYVCSHLPNVPRIVSKAKKDNEVTRAAIEAAKRAVQNGTTWN